MRDISVFGLSAVGTIVLAKLSVLAQIGSIIVDFSFLQATSGLWYPISISISSLGFRTELISQGVAMGLFVFGTALYVVIKAEMFGDALMNRLGRN